MTQSPLVETDFRDMLSGSDRQSRDQGQISSGLVLLLLVVLCRSWEVLECSVDCDLYTSRTRVGVMELAWIS